MPLKNRWPLAAVTQMGPRSWLRVVTIGCSRPRRAQIPLVSRIGKVGRNLFGVESMLGFTPAQKALGFLLKRERWVFHSGGAVSEKHDASQVCGACS